MRWPGHLTAQDRTPIPSCHCGSPKPKPKSDMIHHVHLSHCGVGRKVACGLSSLLKTTVYDSICMCMCMCMCMCVCVLLQPSLGLFSISCWDQIQRTPWRVGNTKRVHPGPPVSEDPGPTDDRTGEAGEAAALHPFGSYGWCWFHAIWSLKFGIFEYLCRKDGPTLMRHAEQVKPAKADPGLFFSFNPQLRVIFFVFHSYGTRTIKTYNTAKVRCTVTYCYHMLGMRIRKSQRFCSSFAAVSAAGTGLTQTLAGGDRAKCRSRLPAGAAKKIAEG